MESNQKTLRSKSHHHGHIWYEFCNAFQKRIALFWQVVCSCSIPSKCLVMHKTISSELVSEWMALSSTFKDSVWMESLWAAWPLPMHDSYHNKCVDFFPHGQSKFLFFECYKSKLQQEFFQFSILIYYFSNVERYILSFTFTFV